MPQLIVLMPCLIDTKSLLPPRRIPAFNETAREMREMIYLWRRSLRLVDGKLRRFLGDVPTTPLGDALRTTLQGLGRSRGRPPE